MTIVHIVLFKFLPEVSSAHKEKFVAGLKTLRELPSVLNSKLIVGGPSVTDPIERSKGYEFALLSFHKDLKALEEYNASDEHQRVTNEYLWPYRDDTTRFDFEVAEGDDHILEGLTKGVLRGNGLAAREAEGDGS